MDSIGKGPAILSTCVKRWRFFACKVGFLLQGRTKFGTDGLFRQTEHAKAVIRTVLYTLTTATNLTLLRKSENKMQVGLRFKKYRKTPLISTYVFSGLATEQVLIFGAVLTFEGNDKAEAKSCKEGVCSIQCFPHTTRCCACFSDYVHTSKIQGYLYSGGITFGALQPTVNFSKN